MGKDRRIDRLGTGVHRDRVSATVRNGMTAVTALRLHERGIDP